MKKQGKFLDIPYDWRFPNRKIIREAMRNKENYRLFTPRVFGWGCGLNFYEFFRNKKRLLVVVTITIFILLDSIALDDITTNEQPNYHAEYTMLIGSVITAIAIMVWYHSTKQKKLNHEH